MASPARASDETTPEPTAHTSDVLVYLDRLGAIRCCWNVRKRDGMGGIQAHSHTIPPGLSIVPAALWRDVKGSPTWRQQEEHEAVRAVAGDAQPLAAGWHATKGPQAIAMVGKTGVLEVLERLHSLESERRPSRPEVAEAIDAQLHKVRGLAQAS